MLIEMSYFRFSDADTSEMEGAADTMPTVSESMPLLTMTANGSALLSPTLLPGNIYSYKICNSSLLLSSWPSIIIVKSTHGVLLLDEVLPTPFNFRDRLF